MRYVALGDSYTIGTSVRPAERWPDQLVRALGPAEPTLELVANLAVNGYASADVIRIELPAVASLEPEYLSLLVGVNDVVRRVPSASYAANVGTILDRLLALVDARHIVTIATPDYTVTPAGADFGEPGSQHQAIVAVNATMEGLATARGIPFVDILDLSLEAALDRRLVAYDGLHPSGLQYARWVDRILPVVRDRIGGSSGRPPN